MGKIVFASVRRIALQERGFRLFQVLFRVLAAVGGGYVFSAAWVAWGAVILPLATGLARSEAVLLSSMLGFLIYLIALIWAFAERKLWRVLALFTAGTLLAFLTAQALKFLLPH